MYVGNQPPQVVLYHRFEKYLFIVSAVDEIAGALREKYLMVLEEVDNKIEIEPVVKREAVRRIDILSIKRTTFVDNIRTVVGAVVFGIENERGMPSRSKQIAQALDLMEMSVTETSRRQAIHFRKS